MGDPELVRNFLIKNATKNNWNMWLKIYCPFIHGL